MIRMRFGLAGLGASAAWRVASGGSNREARGSKIRFVDLSAIDASP